MNLPPAMPTRPLGPIPALGRPVDLPSFRPRVVIDTREQAPLRFQQLAAVSGTLMTGDYAPLGLEHLCAIERKSAADLAASVTHARERFERELVRLRGMTFARVIVTSPREAIAAGQYRSNANPRAVLASCDTFEIRYGVPFVFVADEAAAAAVVERWVWLFCAEVIKAANRLTRDLAEPVSHHATPGTEAGERPTANFS